MSIPLLATKLYIPCKADVLPRERLLRRLDEGLKRRLVLVSAPAGFGKTTLLSDWLGRAEFPAAWLSLDDGDNDIIHFLIYLIAAVQHAHKGVGNAALGLLPTTKKPPVKRILTAFINELTGIEEDFVLVLDDYHAIDEAAIHGALEFLLEHIPPKMHLVISTRADPPLPLARLRGRGELTELRSSDLRFRLDEVRSFFEQLMNMRLSEESIRALDDQTEGWIAGLQMAAVSMQGWDTERVEEFIRAFTGSNRFVLDYLLEEVLQRQPERLQSFLMDTSILKRFSAELCNAVTDREDAESVLSAMEKANLFLCPLDDERRWFRYHRLFADLLLQRLEQSRPDRVAGLHDAASRWFQGRGFVDEAIEHALAARDFERAAALIEPVAESFIMRGELAIFLGWMAALPEGLIASRAELCIFYALALFYGGRPFQEVEARLEDAAHGAGSDRVHGQIMAFRSVVASLQGDLERSTQLSRKALGILPEDDSVLRSLAALNLGFVYVLSGDVEAARGVFANTARVGEKSGNLLLSVLGQSRLAEFALIQGRLGEAEDHCERALRLATEGREEIHPMGGIPLIHRARILYERNELDAARAVLLRGIELTEQWADFGALYGYVVLGWLEQSRGDGTAARAAIRKAKKLAVDFDATELDDLVVDIYEARLAVRQGDMETARRWVRASGLEPFRNGDAARDKKAGGAVAAGSKQGCGIAPCYYVRELQLVTLARVLLADGRAEEAWDVLCPLIEQARGLARLGVVLEILMLQALAKQAQGESEAAETLAGKAIDLAEAEGHVRCFLDEGEPMARLIYASARRPGGFPFAGRLLAAFPSKQQAEAYADVDVGLVEPLSGRELEVLGLVAEGLSNKEIADRIFLSLRTVKWHTTNIFAKLGVGNRTEAAAKARSLGILPQG